MWLQDSELTAKVGQCLLLILLQEKPFCEVCNNAIIAK